MSVGLKYTTKGLVSVERGHGLGNPYSVGLQNLGRIGDAVGFNTKIGILAGNGCEAVDDLAGIEVRSL
jgi:hypothetical protein